MRFRAVRVMALIAAVAAAGAALAAQPPPMRPHSYLRIDGVLGASDDPSHLGWFEVANWGPLRPTSDGGAVARLRIVGAPPQDLMAAVASHRKLHEALMQDVELPGGQMVRTVSFWGFEITGVEPSEAAGRFYAVTLRATKVVCSETQGASGPGGGPCAALYKHPKD